jgi:hypothetical protein
MVSKSRRAALVLVPAFALGACTSVSFPASEVPSHATAAAACEATIGEGGPWRVAVEVQHAATSSLALVSGQSIAICMTTRDDSGFGSTSVAVGHHPVPASPAALSYLTRMDAGNDHVLAGRMPPATRRVVLVFGDRSLHEAVLGDDLWLAWVSGPGEPTLVTALDASGAPLGQLRDPSGIEPSD